MSKLAKMPCCGYEVDSVSTISSKNTKPKPGDVSICLHCGAWNIFVEPAGPSNVRPFEAEDMLSIDDETLGEMRIASAAIRKLRKPTPSSQP